MRMLNVDTDEPVQNACIYLTPSEAQQMLGVLEDIVRSAGNEQMKHAHLNDEDYQREVTITVYTEKNLQQFDERSRRLIAEGM